MPISVTDLGLCVFSQQDERFAGTAERRPPQRVQPMPCGNFFGGCEELAPRSRLGFGSATLYGATSRNAKAGQLLYWLLNRQSKILNPSAQRWVDAVNGDTRFGHWSYAVQTSNRHI